ncbi:cupin domain-containing protein [Falsibacillus albus]|uniref:Cupin domain-containing protein n=1 Tax=Falsibacillus albus TaxID=2478915 RepID=A0A3L7JYQ2_9BACI|nr:cupin domain-containing protein [Falsibacillus albus]RLQ94831.1 cupin domain-containing protein [Falsibacillus albus]
MDVLTINQINPSQESPVPLRTVFEEKIREGMAVSMGTVTIPPGKRVPLQGVSNHIQNEYSIIVKGSILTECGGKTYRVSSGDATFIRAGEEHIAYNDGKEDCEVIWMLVG